MEMRNFVNIKLSSAGAKRYTQKKNKKIERFYKIGESVLF